MLGPCHASSCFPPYASVNTTILNLGPVLAYKLRKTMSLYLSQQMEFLQLFAICSVSHPIQLHMLAPPLSFILLDSYTY